MRKFLDGSLELGARSRNLTGRHSLLRTQCLLVIISVLILSGCARVDGKASCWHTGQGGRTTNQASCDAGNPVPIDPEPGKLLN